MKERQRFHEPDPTFLQIREVLHPSNFRIGFHTQNFYELTFVVAGKGEYSVKKGSRVKAIPVQANSLLIWDGKVPHRCIDGKGTPLRQILICFGWQYLPPKAKSLLNNALKAGQPLMLGQEDPREHARSLIRRIMLEFTNKEMGWEEQCKSHLVVLLVEVLRAQGSKEGRQKKVKDARIRQALSHIRSHFHEPLALGQCARMCNLSQRHFSELVKKCTGRTFVQIVNDCRIEHVKKLLQKTNWKIATIAFQAGFENLSLFNRTFKSLAGTTPQAFRDSRRA